MCGSDVIGVIEDNHLETIGGVRTEVDCRYLCTQTLNCSFYTYFLEEDPNPRVCLLLSRLIFPLQPCATCVTGQVEDCYDDTPGDCSLELNGQRSKHLMFTELGVDINVNVTSPSGCQLRVLAVGGGGMGGGCGAGSGHIQYQTMILDPITIISITVGAQSQSSVVRVNSQTVEARPGGYDRSCDGYSGGGAANFQWGGAYYTGGTNGGDGWGSQDDNPGHGTGEDISEYKMDNYILTPGAGGEGWVDSIGGVKISYGGGGGGILVNGDGPQRNEHQGEGYGGGGMGKNDQQGQQGIVLLEIF